MSTLNRLAAVAFVATLIAAPAVLAQEGEHGGFHGGGAEHGGDRGGGDHEHRGGENRGGDRGYGGGEHGFHGGDDHGYHGGGGYRGGGFAGPVYHGYGRYAYGGYPGYVGPFAVGAILGYYEGRPYYCYHRHHWRWSPFAHRYVAVPSRFC